MHDSHLFFGYFRFYFFTDFRVAGEGLAPETR